MLYSSEKKLVSLLAVLAISCGVCACSGNKAPDTTAEGEKEVISAESNVITEEMLSSLFQKNVDCMMNIFSIGHLPYEGDPVQGDHIYKVADERFPTFADFEVYIRSIYCAEEADRLLYHFPFEDSPAYLDVDGALCVDLNNVGAKGYYVDWTDCDITIDSTDEESCTFIVKGQIEEPAEEPVWEDYFVNGVAVWEDGNWVLEKMIY